MLLTKPRNRPTSAVRIVRLALIAIVLVTLSVSAFQDLRRTEPQTSGSRSSSVRPKRSASRKSSAKAGKAVQVASSLSEALASVDFSLVGLAATVTPATQSVPKNTPTVVLTSLQVPVGADPTQLITGLNPNYRIRGELTGPSLTSPLTIEAQIGQSLQIPALQNSGDHVLQNLRVVDIGTQGEPVVTAVSPDSCAISVIEQLLVTQVQVRELTHDEIVQAGIKITDDSFTAFNFTLGLATTSGTQSLTIPVAFPKLGVADSRPVMGYPTIDAPGMDVPTIVPVMLQSDGGGGVPNGPPGAPPRAIMYGHEQVHIPGVMILPGRVGFLNQFFEAIVIVANGAPNGTPLVLRGMTAKANLPDNGTADSSDDPLRIAETQTGGRVSTLELRQLGPDGKYGTADDISSLAAGESGQASFLLEGLKEGLHPVDFAISGTLEGLPSGPITVKGSVPGSVLVRDTSFAVTFTHPSVVRANQEYDLGMTIFNSGSRDIQGAFAQLSRNSVSGAQLLGQDDGSRQFPGTIKVGEAGSIKWRLKSNVTGAVSASYLKIGGDISGGLSLVTGVGDRNIPLSPDSLILPDQVAKLPAPVVEAARDLLGQAWSIANAPAGSLPAGVASVRKKTVMDKAAELGIAGVRVDFGESTTVSLNTVLRDWLGELQANADIGFLDAQRNTPAGYNWFDNIGAQHHQRLAGPTPVSPVDLHREFADAEMARSQFVSALVTQPQGDPIFGARFVDAFNKKVGFGASLSDRSGDIAKASSSRLTYVDPQTNSASTVGQFLVASNPGTGQWTLELHAWETGVIDVSLLLPLTTRTYSQFQFSQLPITQGRTYRIRFTPIATKTPPAVEELINGSYQPLGITGAATAIEQPAPRVVGAIQVSDEVIAGGDKYGRLVGLLFSKPMQKSSAEKANRYQIGGGTLINSPTNEQIGLPINVTGATLNFGDRIVFVALDSTVGPYIQRDITVTGLTDSHNIQLASGTVPISPRLSLQGIPPGAYLTGRVVAADGAPVANASVIYYAQECPDPLSGGFPSPPKPIALRLTDSEGRYEVDYVRNGDCGPLNVSATHPVSGSEKRVTSPIAYNAQHMNLDLVFLGRGSVKGKITSGGLATPNAMVRIVPELDVVGVQVVEADANGEYTAENVPVGHVSVTAVGTGLVSNASGFAAGTIEGAGQTAIINVSLQDVTGSVSGRVVHSDATPAVGSLVVAYARLAGFPVYVGNGMTTVGYAFTNPDGSFSITGLPIGEIRLEVTDYINGLVAPQTVQLTQTNKDATGVFITLPPGAGSSGGGNATGTVVNDIGTPIPNAIVSSAGRVVRSDAQGHFTLINLTAGDLRIQAIDPISRISGSISTTVQAGQTTSNVNIVLTRPATLQGTVRIIEEGSSTPTPAANVQVTVDGKFRVLTDSEGNYTLPNVQPNARLTLRFVNVARGLAVNQPVIIKPGDTLIKDATFRPGTISGTVFEPTGANGTQAELLIFSPRPNLEQGPDFGLLQTILPVSTQSGPDGSYRINNINPGKYRVSASTVFFPTRVSNGGLLQPNGSEQCDLTLVDTLAGKIQGRVFQPDGVTPVGPSVKVTVGGGSFADATVPTDENGHFEFGEVFSAGTYTLTAVDPNTGNSNRTPISVAKNQDAIAELRLLGRGTLRVRVIDGAGNPATAGSITLDGSSFPNEHGFAQNTPQTNGLAVFENLPEGPYAIEASQFGLGGRGSATVVLGSTVETTIQLQASGAVTGKVFLPGGASAVGLADVKLSQNNRQIGFTVTSDTSPDAGKFSFENVPTGEFTIDVFDNRSGRVGKAAGRVTTQGETATVNVELLPMGTVRGQVTANGVPVDHAVVTIGADGSGLSPVTLTATTDHNGQYRFNGIPAGRFQVSVTNGPGGLGGAATGVLAGSTEPLPDSVVDIALEPTQNVTGTVFRADGVTPVPGAAVTVIAGRRAYYAATRDNGVYRVDFVPLGEVLVKATAPIGFDRGKAAVATGTQASATLNINVTLNGAGAIAGTALDHSGSPLSAGKVVFTNDEGDSPAIISSFVQSNGRFEIKDAPTGRFTLRLTTPGLLGAGTATGDLHNGEQLDLSIRLEDAGEVTGRVKSEDGTRNITGAGVILTLTRPSGVIRFYSNTGSDGRWSFNNVPLGTVSVAVYDTGSTGVAVANNASLTTNGQVLDLGTMLIDNTPIRVVSLTPANGSINVATTAPITVTFSEAALPSSVNTESIQLIKDLERQPVNITLSADGRVATIVQSPRISDSSTFTLTISTEVSDLASQSLQQDVSSTFATRDETAPSVLTLTPEIDSVEVPVATVITATLNEAVDPTQDLSNVIQLRETDDSGPLVPGATVLSGAGKTLTFTPAQALAGSKFYVATVTGQRDAAGNAQTAVAMTRFTTFNPPPAVSILTPAEGATVSENQSILLSASVTDNTPGSVVVFTINEIAQSPIGAPYERPFTVPVGVPTLAITATVYDDLGKTATTPVRNVNVTVDPGATITGIVTSGEQVVSGLAVTMTASNGTFTTTTDSNGQYRFDNAGIGLVQVTATDPNTNLRARAKATVTSFADTINLNLPLIASGVVTGTVLRADGATPVAQAEVTIKANNGVVIDTTTTDAEGRYSIDYIPFATFVVDVKDSNSPDRGRANGSTATSSQPRNVDVVMNGLGRVVVTVRNSSNNALVSGAQVLVISQTIFGGSQTGTTLADGTATFESMLAGTFGVTATDPVSTLSGGTGGNVGVGATTNVTVQLQPSTTLQGRVFDVDGTTPVNGATVELSRPFESRQTTTAADGTYRFDFVRLDSYTVTVKDNAGRLRARAFNVQLFTNNSPVTRDFTFIGLGSVTGQVFNPDGSTAPNVGVIIRTNSPNLSGSFFGQTNSEGSYRINDVPVGSFVASATSNDGSLRGEITGQLTEHAQTAIADIQLLNNSQSLPARLFDLNGYLYDLNADASLQQGSENIFSGDFGANRGAFLLDIISEGANYRFNGNNLGAKELDGRQIAIREQGLAGLNVTRKMFVPRDGYFARYLEVLTNPTSNPITVDLLLQNNFFANEGGLHVVNTSSGDNNLNNSDRWVVIDDSKPDEAVDSTSAPAVTFAWDGNDAQSHIGDASFSSTSEQAKLSYRWQNITIAPGATVAYLHFGVQQTTRGGAQASALRLVQLPPEALTGLSLDEINAIRNFNIPAGGVSALGPLALNGKVTGRVVAADGVTPVPHARVFFKSNNPLFGRAQDLFANEDGYFTFESRFEDFNSFVVPVDSFALFARHSFTGVASNPPTPGAFAENQTETNQNVIFNGAAVVRGIVRRSNGQPVTSGFVQINIFNHDTDYGVSIGGDGSYVFTGVEAGNYRVTAFVDSGQGSALTVQANVVATVNQTTTQDLVLPATGNVSGIVRDGSDSPRANIRVRISDNDTSRSSITDAEGRYSFSDLPAGTFSIFAEEPLTRIETEAPVTIVADQTIEKDLNLIGLGRLTVQVNFANGTPAVQSRVEISSAAKQNGSVAAGFTNSSGQFVVTAMPVGDFRIEAHYPQFDVIASETAGNLPSHGADISTTATLPATGSVAGRVTYVPGVPAVNAEIVIFGDGVPFQEVRTNASGDYSLAPIPVGKPFVIRATEQNNFDLSKRTGELIIANAGETLPLDFSFGARARVKTTVLRADGSPFSGVSIEIADAVRQFRNGYGSTGADGTLTVSNIPEGEFRVYASTNSSLLGTATGNITQANHGQTVEVTISSANVGTVRGTIFAGDGQSPLRGDTYIEVIDLANNEVLTSTYTNDGTYRAPSFASGASGFKVRVYYQSTTAEATGSFASDNETVTINLTVPVGIVRGQVKFEDGTSVENPNVQFVQKNADGTYQPPIAAQLFDPLGNYAVFGPTAGDFTLIAQDSASGLVANVQGTVASVATPVALDVQLPASGRVTGKVLARDSSGSLIPMGNATVTLVAESNGFERNVTTNPDGSYQFDRVQVGQLALRAQHPEHYYIFATSTGVLSNSGETVNIDILLPDMGSVTGTVFAADSVTPVPHVSVYISSPSMTEPQHRNANSSGVFTFTDVPVGPVFVQAIDDNNEIKSFGTASGTLGAANTTTTVNVALVKNSSLSGIVRNADGSLAANATVTAIAVGGSGSGSHSFYRYRRTVQTNEAGYYEFTGVPVGEVTITARDESFTIFGLTSVQLGEAALTNVDIALGNAVAGPFNLDGSDDFRYDVYSDGVVYQGGRVNGSTSSYQGAFSLFVNGQSIPNLDAFTVTPDGRQLDIAPVGFNGLSISRQIYSPASGGFIRYAEKISNPTNSTITISLRTEVNLSSGSSTRLVVAPTATNNLYAITQNFDLTSTPALGFVLGGPGAVGASTQFSERRSLQSYGWTITIPPGQTRILLHYGIQRGAANAPEAQTLATSLVNLSEPQALDRLTPVERSQVVNFIIP